MPPDNLNLLVEIKALKEEAVINVSRNEELTNKIAALRDLLSRELDAKNKALRQAKDAVAEIEAVHEFLDKCHRVDRMARDGDGLLERVSLLGRVRALDGVCDNLNVNLFNAADRNILLEAKVNTLACQVQDLKVKLTHYRDAKRKARK
jgi:hypothetical protein